MLVDELGTLIKRHPEGNEGLAREILLQGAAVWSHGMDADPSGDLQQRAPDGPSGRQAVMPSAAGGLGNVANGDHVVAPCNAAVWLT